MLYTEHYYPTLAGIICLSFLFFNPLRIKIAFKTLLLFNTFGTTLVFQQRGAPYLAFGARGAAGGAYYQVYQDDYMYTAAHET